MKRFKYVIVAGLLLLTMSACNSSGNSISNDGSSVSSNSASATDSSLRDESSESSDNTVSDDYSEIYESSEEDSYEPTISWISDRSVQYKEADDMYNVLFALSDQNGTKLKTSGVAEITIKDEKENLLYNKSINFTESDFTEWTNKNRDDYTLGCWLNIPRTDVKGSSSSSGTLSLKVITESGIFFDTYNMTITNLPEKTVEIKLPEVPVTHVDQRYSDEVSYITVHSLTYKQTYLYKGEASVEFEVLISLDGRTGKRNVSRYAEIGYKVYDEDGVVVESGDIYTNNLAIGEKSKNTFTISDLDPMKTYTLELFDRI